jgi:carboxylesterase
VFHSRRRTLETQRLLNPEGTREFHAEGRAPSILAFHGFTGTATELRPLVDRIAEAGYAVDVPLLPGHGGLPADLQETSFDDWCAAMRTRRDALLAKHGRIVLLGFSMGTLVALKLAAEARDGRLAGLVILGCALELQPYFSVPFSAFARAGWKVPDAYLLKLGPADMTDREAARALTTYDRHPLRAAYEVYRAGQAMREEVSRITCPVFIGHGKKDRVCRPRASAWLAEHVGSRDVTARVYTKSSHIVAADVEREDVARDVLSFLGRVGREEN